MMVSSFMIARTREQARQSARFASWNSVAISRELSTFAKISGGRLTRGSAAAIPMGGEDVGPVPIAD
jgi:hypothetical protein